MSESSVSRRVTVPSYLPKFQCLGSTCEDNCCAAGWNIAVDARTFKRYETLNHDLGPILRAAVPANPANRATPQDFARIKLDERRRCPFLTDDSLCGVQGALGPDYLSDVCLSYPRRSGLVDGTLERAGVLSCPEVARLALLDPGAMDLVTIEEERSARMTLASAFVPDALPEGDLRRLAGSIRAESVGLLRSREGTLEARLLALGMALQKLGRRRRARVDDPAEIFGAYRRSLPAIENSIAEIPTELSVQLELLRELTIERFATGLMVVSGRYSSAVDRLAKGLHLTATKPAGDDAARRFRSAYDAFYRPYVDANPHVLENLLINQIYASSFPFGRSTRPFDDYVLMVVRFALVRLLLVGVASYEQRLDDEIVVEVVQPFERVISHDPKFLQHILDVLRKNRAANMPSMAALIVA